MTHLFDQLFEQTQYVIMPGKGVDAEFYAHYSQIYSFWQKVWSATFAEVNGTPTLYSDDFTRQHEVSSLSYNGQPFGLFLFDWLDLSFASHVQHSYFKYYDPEILNMFKTENSNHVMVMSYLTVDSKWRRKISGVSVSDILVSLAIKRFWQSNADVLITFTRNNRGTHELGYRHGAIPLKTGLKAYNINSDILGFYKNKVHMSPLANTAHYANHLWESRKIYPYNYSEMTHTKLNFEPNPQFLTNRDEKSISETLT